MTKKKPTTKQERQVDENLRRVYQEMLDEEIPDRFKDLLAQLGSADTSKKKDGSET